MNEETRVSELETLRATCRRLTHENHALRETVSVLRTGANALALEIAALEAEMLGMRAPDA